MYFLVTEAPLREDLSSCIKKHFECMSRNRIYCMKSYNECSLKVLDQHQENSGDLLSNWKPLFTLGIFLIILKKFWVPPFNT